MIKNLTLILPPLAEQRRVAGILGSLDEKIENNRRLIRTAEALARTLFKKHIVSNEESEGWENTTLGDKIHPKRGKNITRNEAREGNIPVVAGGLEPSCYHDTSNTIAPVITISSSGANAGFVRLWNENVWSADSSFIDKTITENIYFYYVLLSINQDILYGKQTGTGQPHIYPSHIESIKMPNVPDETISAFNAAVEPLFAEIGFLTRENQTLAATRDKLLRKLIK
ncbi:MAG: restriction endonuclease subunit S [Treponematales bacterium]